MSSTYTTDELREIATSDDTSFRERQMAQDLLDARGVDLLDVLSPEVA